MRRFFSKKPLSHQVSELNRGALLIEILITISILAVILSLGAQSSFVSLRASKSASEKDGALNLAIETMEAVRSAAEEKWQNLYDLTKGSANHHYPSQSSGKWIISNNGDEVLTINDTIYARYFIVDNMSRDVSTRAIENTYNSANDDPSTQKVTVFVTTNWATSTAVTFSQYFSRWRNKVCNQTAWTTGGSGNSVKTCPDTNYDTKTNITPSGSLEICQGGC